jgi:hypothetical protein
VTSGSWRWSLYVCGPPCTYTGDRVSRPGGGDRIRSGQGGWEGDELGCPILLRIRQTFLSKKCVIPIYEMFGFLSFFLHHLEFPPRPPKIQRIFTLFC